MRGTIAKACDAFRIALLLLGAPLTACGASEDSDPDALVSSSSPGAPTQPSRHIWGETDTKGFTRLGSAGILAAFAGRLIVYSPPGMADAGAHEQFHADGQWSAIHYGRGPTHYSGRWKVEGDRLCITVEDSRAGEPWPDMPVCRDVWRDGKKAGLLLEHFRFGRGKGLLRIAFRPPPA